MCPSSTAESPVALVAGCSSDERFQAVVAALGAALDAFDAYTAEHSCETSRLAGRVAERLAVGDAGEVELIAPVAALHDVGKIGIPQQVLHKAGPLTEEEHALIREHPVIGERILRRIAGLAQVADAIRHEHERWDGAGYPDRLAGADIPLASRVVLACDAWHAMTTNRPYRPALTRGEALAELRRCAGSQFDPEVTRVLLGVLEGRLPAAA